MTAPSLIVAGVEVIDKNVNDTVRLAAGFDFGEGEPDQTTIASLYLDGDAVAGRRTKNRLMRLPLNVYGTGLTLSATITNLLQAVSQDTFTVQWTPDGGLPIIFDCYRATWERPRDPNVEAGGRSPLILEFQAKPFGRSPDVQTVTVAGAQTQLDSYATAPTGAALDTSIKYEGTGSARVTCTSSGLIGGSLRVYVGQISRTYGAPQDLTGMNAVTHRIRWPAPGPGAPLYPELTLHSAAGDVTINAARGFKAGAQKWALVGFPLTGDLGSLDLTTVTGYTLTLVTGMVSGGGSTTQIWVDDQRMRPPSGSLATTTHAVNLLLPGVVGSARTPVNLAVDNGSTFVAFLLHRPPVEQDIDAQILTSLNGGIADQTVTIDTDGSAFNGTYSVVLGVHTLGSGDESVSVTVSQYVDGVLQGDPLVLTADYTAGDHLLPVGEVTLPLYAIPDDNTTTTYEIEVNETGAQRYTELMLLDTRGQTVFTDRDLAAARAAVYVDEPPTGQSGSTVYTTSSDRSAAHSAMRRTITSGGPVILEPGENKVLAWVDVDVPSVTATYYPRWIDERIT